MATASPAEAAGPTNPAERPEFRQALLRHVDTLAATVTFAPGNTPADSPTTRRRQQWEVAAAWVYLSAVAAWAEDHHLVVPLLRHHPAGARRTPANSLMWLGRAFANLTVHPATQWLMHPRYNPALWAGSPSGGACAELIDWWGSDAPALAYPHTGEQPASITGWPIGDLLPLLSPQRRARHALVQTPYWVADFLLDRTLLPAAEQFRHEALLTTIDPTCGTGHVLIRAADQLWSWYRTGTMTPRSVPTQPRVPGGASHPPEQALRRLLASLDGIDIDPLTAAVARLRLTVYIGHLLTVDGLLPTPLRLADIPPGITPRVWVGDTLLLGKISRARYAAVHPHLADLPGAAFPHADFPWPG